MCAGDAVSGRRIAGVFVTKERIMPLLVFPSILSGLVFLNNLFAESLKETLRRMLPILRGLSNSVKVILRFMPLVVCRVVGDAALNTNNGVASIP